MVMETNRILLETMGFRVVEAPTGRDALDRANGFDGDLDLALLDLKLPDMDAKDVYKGLTKSRPGMKIIVYSGYTQEETIQEILDEGASGFLQKPFSMEELAGMIEEVLHK